jgi:osmotically-inducible protein OsmY
VKPARPQDPDVKGTEVQVETFNGVVQLSGFVDSAAVADRAVGIAQKVPGVVSVKNDMRLKPQG